MAPLVLGNSLIWAQYDFPGSSSTYSAPDLKSAMSPRSPDFSSWGQYLGTPICALVSGGAEI